MDHPRLNPRLTEADIPPERGCFHPIKWSSGKCMSVVGLYGLFLFCFLAKQIPMAWMAGPYQRAVGSGGVER